MGGAEAIFGYLYTLLERPESTGVVGRLTMRVVEWTFGFIGYMIQSTASNVQKARTIQQQQGPAAPPQAAPVPPPAPGPAKGKMKSVMKDEAKP